MQATTTFKVGDKVRAVSSLYDCDGLLKGETGTVVELDGRLISVVHSRNNDVWNMWPRELELVRKPTAFDDLRLTPQAKIVLSHLKKRQRISPAEALTVYGISRLASCIHEIRNRAGYTVKTEQRRDEHGHKYAKYHLAA